MKIVQIHPQNPDKDIIQLAVDVIRNGGVVVHPTDTCYGLAVDIGNKEAVKKLYKLKGMSENKPVSIIVRDVEDALKYAVFNNKEKVFLKKYWPGQLTAVLNRNDDFPFDFNREQRSIGLRIPRCSVSLAIVRELGRPITTTSANISGAGETYNLYDILNQFKNQDLQPDLILDGGELERRKPSTVISFLNGRVEVIREGEISL